jgi:anti-anti-sigma regulatory factor
MSPEAKTETKKKTTRKTPAKKATKKKSTAGEYRLTGDLTLPTAPELKKLFIKAISAKGDLTFRFDKVGDVDLSFVQILCATHRAVHEKGRKITFTGNVPESFTRLLEESGLNVHVGCSLDNNAECPWSINSTSEKQ